MLTGGLVLFIGKFVVFSNCIWAVKILVLFVESIGLLLSDILATIKLSFAVEPAQVKESVIANPSAQVPQVFSVKGHSLQLATVQL